MVRNYCGTVYKISDSRAINPECGGKRTPETKTLEEYKAILDAKSGTEVVAGETWTSAQYDSQKENQRIISATEPISEQLSHKIGDIERDVEKLLVKIFFNHRHIFCNDTPNQYPLEHILLSESHGSISYFEIILKKIQQLWSTRFEVIGEKSY